jgi:hypothetical protein
LAERDALRERVATLEAALRGIEEDAQRAAGGPVDDKHMRYVLAECVAHVARAALKGKADPK